MKRLVVPILAMLAVAIVASGCSWFKGQESASQQQAAATQTLEAGAQAGGDYFYSARELEQTKEQAIAEQGTGRDAGSASQDAGRVAGAGLERTLPGRVGRLPLVPISGVTITTQAYDLDTTGIVGEPYEQEIRVGGCESCTWGSTTLPAGLSGAEVAGVETKFKIQGTPAVAWEGDITVYVKESSSATWQDQITWHLAITTTTPPDDGGGDDEADCMTPIQISLDDFPSHQKPYDLSKPFGVMLGATDKQEPTFKVIGDKGPFTWTITSKVEDSYHCHMRSPFLTSPYSETFLTGFPPGSEDACEAAAGFTEWTQNTTWMPKDGTIISDGRTELTMPAFRPEPAVVTVETEGRTLGLEGGLKYDGPLPVGGSYAGKNPREVLTVSVTGTCPASSSPPLALTFDLGYPEDTKASPLITVGYRNLNDPGDYDSLRLFLLSEKPPHPDCDEQDSYKPDVVFGDQVLAKSYVSLEIWPSCTSETCEMLWMSPLEWTDVLKGISQVKHVLVGFAFDPCHWTTEDGQEWCNGVEEGDMDVRTFTIQTPHWKLFYDDQDEGNNQMKKNNGTHSIYPQLCFGGYYYLTDTPGVAFKRKPFADYFLDRWKGIPWPTPKND